MSIGAAIISVLKKKKWRRSQYDVRDLGVAEVSCLSLTDLSNMPVPHRNTFVSSKSEDNLLDAKLYLKSRSSKLTKCKENWKRTSLNLSIDPEDDFKNSALYLSTADSAISLSFRDSVRSSRRPVSCYVDYTSSREFLSVSEEADESSNTDFGYDSMNASSDSVLSLVRKSSIHSKSREIMIKRRQFVKKRSRDSQVFSDDENNDLKYSKSNSKKNENDIPRDSKEIANRLAQKEATTRRNRDEKCRSVHFDDNTEDESFVKQQLTKSVSTLTLCRNNSVQLKSWQIRRQRRAMLNKHRRAIRQLENMKYEERLV
ncbi:uncharacterized protein LOC133175874 [Saccostrea echinata]|uniref:uncharacterized protein LOC133175874 n=1 Tax=Saccostrea echinata TaxID=191078 RepID=UPI002A7F0BB5|nr:uncharacterized protein LOC133175874 [Saccostrea echinata]